MSVAKVLQSFPLQLYLMQYDILLSLAGSQAQYGMPGMLRSWMSLCLQDGQNNGVLAWQAFCQLTCCCCDASAGICTACSACARTRPTCSRSEEDVV